MSFNSPISLHSSLFAFVYSRLLFSHQLCYKIDGTTHDTMPYAQRSHTCDMREREKVHPQRTIQPTTTTTINSFRKTCQKLMSKLLGVCSGISMGFFFECVFYTVVVYFLHCCGQNSKLKNIIKTYPTFYFTFSISVTPRTVLFSRLSASF